MPASVVPTLDGVSDERSPGTRRWAIVGALSVTETVSWGVLYYAFAVFLLPMQRELGFSAAELTGAFSLALLVAGIAGIGVGRYLDRHGPRALMTAGSVGGRAARRSRGRGWRAWRRSTRSGSRIGLVMATVLYEPAFTVLAKWFPDAGRAAAGDDRADAGRRAGELHLPAARARR